ncbi:MAG: MFS transporter [Proteobacteria bacterium]|nr:MFS transporter [Pseudomonadota bacterium]MBU1583612.1 MFS transporter [Pseudomonadota bacterium]MBU2431899.1 MFS transporter [Pseudomonadota bacterium]MBU2455736.1 MFS transporter [Pseudomonadota bacterium]MBU2628432.1 MFS transporter [Pseudomonadota bacterium]
MEIKTNKAAVHFEVGGPKATFVLVICSLLWMINFMDRQVLSVVLEPMKIDLGLTDAQAGWITTSLFMGVAVFAIPFSFMADQWSRKKSIGIMAIFWSIATFFTGMGKSFLGIFIPHLMTGVGQAGFSSAGMALISSSFPEDILAKKMGIFNLFQIIGISLGLILGGYLSAHHGGWKTPFFVFAVPGILIGFAAFFMQDYSTAFTPAATGEKKGLTAKVKSLLEIPTLVWFYAGYSLFTALAFAVLTWSPALIMRKFQIGEDMAGLFMAATGAFAVPGVLLGGSIADKWQKKHPAGRMFFAAVMVLLSTAAIMASLLCVVFFPDHWEGDFSIKGGVALVLFSLFCAASAAVNPAVMAATQSVVSRDTKGMVWGLGLTIILIFGGAWSPTLTGYLSDRLGGGANGLACALLIISSLGIIGFFCFWKSSRHFPEDAKNNNNDRTKFAREHEQYR